MTDLAAIVLAGGRSSRMGRDKALLSLGPETLLQYTCRVAANCATAVFVITPYPERYQALLPAGVDIIQETPLDDQPVPYHGPLVGLLQAMDYLADQSIFWPWLLALACDLPNLSADVLHTWKMTLPHQSSRVVACLPRRQGRWEPLCGFYRFTCHASLQQYVRQGRRSFQGWLNHQPVVQLPLSHDIMLMNLNTPEDVQWWQETRE